MRTTGEDLEVRKLRRQLLVLEEANLGKKAKGGRRGSRYPLSEYDYDNPFEFVKGSRSLLLDELADKRFAVPKVELSCISSKAARERKGSSLHRSSGPSTPVDSASCKETTEGESSPRDRSAKSSREPRGAAGSLPLPSPRDGASPPPSPRDRMRSPMQERPWRSKPLLGGVPGKPIDDYLLTMEGKLTPNPQAPNRIIIKCPKHHVLFNYQTPSYIDPCLVGGAATCSECSTGVPTLICKACMPDYYLCKACKALKIGANVFVQKVSHREIRTGSPLRQPASPPTKTALSPSGSPSLAAAPKQPRKDFRAFLEEGGVDMDDDAPAAAAACDSPSCGAAGPPSPGKDPSRLAGSQQLFEMSEPSTPNGAAARMAREDARLRKEAADPEAEPQAGGPAPALVMSGKDQQNSAQSDPNAEETPPPSSPALVMSGKDQQNSAQSDAKAGEPPPPPEAQTPALAMSGKEGETTAREAPADSKKTEHAEPTAALAMSGHDLEENVRREAEARRNKQEEDRRAMEQAFEAVARSPGESTFHLTPATPNTVFQCLHHEVQAMNIFVHGPPTEASPAETPLEPALAPRPRRTRPNRTPVEIPIGKEPYVRWAQPPSPPTDDFSDDSFMVDTFDSHTTNTKNENPEVLCAQAQFLKELKLDKEKDDAVKKQKDLEEKEEAAAAAREAKERAAREKEERDAAAAAEEEEKRRRKEEREAREAEEKEAAREKLARRRNSDGKRRGESRRKSVPGSEEKKKGAFLCVEGDSDDESVTADYNGSHASHDSGETHHNEDEKLSMLHDESEDNPASQQNGSPALLPHHDMREQFDETCRTLRATQPKADAPPRASPKAQDSMSWCYDAEADNRRGSGSTGTGGSGGNRVDPLAPCSPKSPGGALAGGGSGSTFTPGTSDKGAAPSFLRPLASFDASGCTAGSAATPLSPDWKNWDWPGWKSLPNAPRSPTDVEPPIAQHRSV
ncbi:hypothetical protein DIPPA_30620 [Diplonema papillatum]|nr:hypothetical protein DIPPA_30620 [Diplonema papillatum]